jgi:lipoprotein-anchoring transpeptidase ErfK/SrfK
MLRRSFLRMLAVGVVALPVEAGASSFWDILRKKKPIAKKLTKTRAKKIVANLKTKNKKIKITRPVYKGRTEVDFASYEKPGTLIIKTQERALYRVLGNGKATRFLVAVGKEGFSWSGVAKVAMKRENPIWTPPPEMIERTPKYAQWAGGMPGGLPINPLGPRAMYLYSGKADTGFRIHGTIHPESIGTAASSGCIRMLNKEVIELYDLTKLGTKVIVI